MTESQTDGPSSMLVDATLAELGIAYRKAKADLFYSSRSCCGVLSEYESDLLGNLRELQSLLSLGKLPPFGDRPWTLAPKGALNLPEAQEFVQSDPSLHWEHQFQRSKKAGNQIRFEFRLMECLPIAFHVLAALWTNRVGQKFEARLTESARGNRLRRDKHGDVNALALGSTVSYLPAYRKWREDAFDAMEDALSRGVPIVAVTTDITSFYHKLDARFMLDLQFHDQIGIQLDEAESALHRLFIRGLRKWALETPIGQGLPVGLAASSIIANVALFELDRLFEREIAPIYYGRYVDDIILVMKDGAGFVSQDDVWHWLVDRMQGALKWSGVGSAQNLQFHRPYLGSSEIVFGKTKSKVFVLAGAGGQAVLNAIRSEVNARTSEWRALPALPDSEMQLEAQLLSAVRNDGGAIINLRSADRVSVRRAGVALRVRDLEAYARLLRPMAWQGQRQAFLDAFSRHVLVPSVFADFFDYVPRVIQLATSSGDFAQLRRILGALQAILQQLSECSCVIKAHEANSKIATLGIFAENLQLIIREAIESALPASMNRASLALWGENISDGCSLYKPRAMKEIQATYRQYVCQDLARPALKACLMPNLLTPRMRAPLSRAKIGNMSEGESQYLLDARVMRGCNIVMRKARLVRNGQIPSGLLFPTRPFSVPDLYLLHDDPFSREGSEEIAAVLLALRGFYPNGHLPIYAGRRSESPIDIVPWSLEINAIRIAVTSWATSDGSWEAAASLRADPDGSRLDRLNLLLNEVMRSGAKIDYVVMPELAIPAPWFLAAADKLRKRRTALVCGVDYLHARGKMVRNQVWASLPHTALGFPGLAIYRQDKQRPALHEERALYETAGKKLRPEMKNWSTPPIINHGGFCFSILVCSELTNIAYRSALRGRIDALLVPEWNQDTDSFGALVESAALDMHCYIVQCNNRRFGDSRIRAPFKESWLRDVVRVKGGIADYFVTGEIDIAALRAFQSKHRSPDGPYKPVPDGFEISHERRGLDDVAE